MDVRITPLGHATCLIEAGSLCLLTDPVFAPERPWLGRLGFAGWRRSPAPLAPRELPPVDAVLLSHAHHDHTHTPSLRRLPTSAVVVCHEHNDDLVRRFDDRRPLRWGESTVVAGHCGAQARITAIAAAHYGARLLFDRWRGYGGFVVALSHASAPGEERLLLFAGDTAQTDLYAEVRAALAPRRVELAMMPIGAYDPWIHNHCSPEQAWQMAVEDLGAELLLPIHFDVFPQGREPVGAPLERLQAAAAATGQTHRIVGTTVGDPVVLAAAPPPPQALGA
jgi:L-ascorbate metabolism protein UlaG (beta-lactamase superfamily)